MDVNEELMFCIKDISGEGGVGWGGVRVNVNEDLKKFRGWGVGVGGGSGLGVRMDKWVSSRGGGSGRMWTKT